MCKTQLVPISMSLKEQFFFKSSGFWILEIKEKKTKMGYDYDNQPLRFEKNPYLGMSQAHCAFRHSCSMPNFLILLAYFTSPISHHHKIYLETNSARAPI